MKRPIYYDTETTGVSPEKDCIIELAAYDGVHERSFCSFIKPTIPIPAEATQIHGITNEMVADAPPFEQVARDFLAFCSDGGVLIAHNNDAFDLPFLGASFRRHQMEFPSFETIDSLKWARKYRPDLPRHSLQYLRQIYALEERTAHRALSDVLVLRDLFMLMIDDLPLTVVMELLKEPSSLHHMPFGKHQGKPLKEVPKDYLVWLQEQGAFEKAENRDLKKAFVQLGMLG